MAAGKKNIVIEKGATFKMSLLWKDQNNAPVDLTGYTARMQVRKTISSDTALLSLTTENGDIVLGGTAGTILIEVSDADTSAIPDNVKSGVYDLEMESASGIVTRLIEGEADIRPEVTR